MSWDSVWFVAAPVTGIGLLVAASWPGGTQRPARRLPAWYVRLDPAKTRPSCAQRMALASSLATVRAAWAGDLLCAAYAAETDAPVRGRIIGALVSGEHFHDLAVYVAALEAGGLDAAAVQEALGPRASGLPWAQRLLASGDPGGAGST